MAVVRTMKGAVLVAVLVVVSIGVAVRAAEVEAESAERMPYDWRERQWVYPIIEESAPVVLAPHPASPLKHVEPEYEPSAAARAAAEASRLSPAELEHRRLWHVHHPMDGTPFKPVYLTPKPAVSQAAAPVPVRPTVMSPFMKPERVVGSHYPAIPDEPCVCKYAVSDPRLCTTWKRAPLYECIKRGADKKCYKYGAAPVRHMCPCVHADNTRRCYVWAPPGTRAEDYKPTRVALPTKPESKKRRVVTAKDVTRTAVPADGSARRLALQSTVEERLARVRAAAAARWEAKKNTQSRARDEARAKRRAARVALQAAARRYKPATSGAALTSDNNRVVLRSNGNARQQRASVAVAATEFDKDVLTRTLFGEAQHDDEPGRRAVAWSLINRARDEKHRFPKTIADVCKQVGQFRTWKDAASSKAANELSRHAPIYIELRRIVDDAIAGRSVDPTQNGAFYYNNGHVAPQWSQPMRCTFRSKAHTFCHAR